VAAALGSPLKARDLTGVIVVSTAGGAPGASAGWDVCDLFDLHVDHVPGPAGNDALPRSRWKPGNVSTR
jgi:hypothetical protein